MNDISEKTFSMDEIIEDVTIQTIKHINSTPELYLIAKKAGKKSLDKLKEVCIEWAEEHNNEFGVLFQTELDMVNFSKVRKMI